MTTAVSPSKKSTERPNYIFPVGLLILVLLPLLLMPLAAVFIFAFQGGLTAFIEALGDPDAQFALRFSLLIAFGTAVINAVLGTYAAYVLSKYRFPGERPLSIIVNLPVAIPTVVVGTSLLCCGGQLVCWANGSIRWACSRCSPRLACCWPIFLSPFPTCWAPSSPC
jgi:ABC-type sulfate transport system permease component